MLFYIRGLLVRAELVRWAQTIWDSPVIRESELLLQLQALAESAPFVRTIRIRPLHSRKKRRFVDTVAGVLESTGFFIVNEPLNTMRIHRHGSRVAAIDTP